MDTIAVIGLGYVGLPLAVEFGKTFPTVGFDLSAEKVAAYKRHVDPTGEVSTATKTAWSKLPMAPQSASRFSGTTRGSRRSAWRTAWRRSTRATATSRCFPNSGPRIRSGEVPVES
mgnify:CR=1 FL=1